MVGLCEATVTNAGKKLYKVRYFCSSYLQNVAGGLHWCIVELQISHLSHYVVINYKGLEV